MKPAFGVEFPLKNRFSGAGTKRRDFNGLKITKIGLSKIGNEFCGPTNQSSRFLVKNEDRMSVARLQKKMHPNCITPTVKHGGGSVMGVRGCFSYTGVGDLHRIKGILDQKSYHSILRRHCITSSKRLIGRRFTMQ